MLKIKYLLLFILIIFSSGTIYSQETIEQIPEQSSHKVTIRGRVIDDDRKPVEFALIHVNDQLASTATDLQAKYSLTCNSADSLVVTFSMLGYETRKRTLKNPSDTITLDVMLPHLGYELNEVEMSLRKMR